MNIDNNEYDAVLGRRLSAALRVEADHVEAPADAWARFQERSSATNIVIGESEGPDSATVSVIGPPRDRKHPWRVPLIAAAAVAAIAVATSAIATGGFGATHRVASPGGGSDASTPVRVPVDTSYEIYAMAGGAAGNPPASRPLGSTSASPALGPEAVWMSFVDGTPPNASLSGRYVDGRGAMTPVQDAQRQRPDGTPLGYITRGTSITGDAPGVTAWRSTTVWGAVGPDVAQLQIMTALPPGPDPGFGGTQMHYTIDSGKGTVFSSPGSETSTWTPLVGGWNGFAVLLPADATWATVIALGTTGQVLQSRRFDLVTGQVADDPIATGTGLPPASATATLSPTAVTVSGSDPPNGPSSPVTETGQVLSGTSWPPPPGAANVTAAGGSEGQAPTSLDPRDSRAAAAQSSAVQALSSAMSTASSALQEVIRDGNGPQGPFVAVYSDVPGQPAHAALFEGTVRVRDGCVAIVSADATTTAIPVFPRSQVSEATAPAVLRWRGKDYAEGDAIAVGGSFAADGYYESQPGWPAQCLGKPWGVSPYN
ncbi:MAG: hypothetical protein BGO26_14800 [Actinobacteria bacterium 69-20]|jgi:hypothetical protein|nr:hypothetical protein [Actinomycetota bacterium]OJV29571.1 MAG: hypothetical protein BGO26_14800 [Actinobacteria bacterium 69-20]